MIIVGPVVLPALLGLLIGWERQVAGSEIKACTIALAALTAASLSARPRDPRRRRGRIVQGIVTGIGFLGAGVIIRGTSGEDRRLTTAARMWAMTGVGVAIAIGSGHSVLGVLLGLLVYIIIAVGEWPVLTLLSRRR